MVDEQQGLGECCTSALRARADARVAPLHLICSPIIVSYVGHSAFFSFVHYVYIDLNAATIHVTKLSCNFDVSDA